MRSSEPYTIDPIGVYDRTVSKSVTGSMVEDTSSVNSEIGKGVNMSAEINDPVQCSEAIGKWLVEEVPEAWDKIVVDFKIIVMDDVSERTIVYTPSRKSSL